jgi:hypothetical protein
MVIEKQQLINASSPGRRSTSVAPVPAPVAGGIMFVMTGLLRMPDVDVDRASAGAGVAGTTATFGR